MRVAPFRAVGGFDARLIAGEEPELCLRLRRTGHGIVRLDQEMTLHDAALLRFGQFWRRSVRAGHAYAEAAYRHGADRAARNGPRQAVLGPELSGNGAQQRNRCGAGRLRPMPASHPRVRRRAPPARR